LNNSYLIANDMRKRNRWKPQDLIDELIISGARRSTSLHI